MRNNTIKEITVSVLLIVLAILLLNPLHFWMPDSVVICMLALTLVSFGVFSSYILKEKVFDERDAVNRSYSGRNAFLVGSAVLMLGIVSQGYYHRVDPWLVLTLILMIITKFITRIWSDRDL